MKVSDSLRELSDLFVVGNGMKQGYFLTPTLFLIFLSMVLSNAFTDSTPEVWIKSRSGANLFNTSQLKSVRNTRDIPLCMLTFADDTTFKAHNLQDAQKIISNFLESVKAFGLKINPQKTEVMYQPSPGSHDIFQNMQIDDQVLTSKQI